MKIEKEARKKKKRKVPGFPPKRLLTNVAELKSLHLFNLISLFLFPSLQSQHPLHLISFSLPEESLRSVSFFLFFLNSRVVESSASRFRCIKCKYPPIFGEKPRLKAERRVWVAEIKVRLLVKMGRGFLWGKRAWEHS